MSVLLDGKKVAAKVKEDIRKKVESLKKSGEHIPSLSVLLVGDNSASHIYVSQKEKAFEAVGMGLNKIVLPESISQKALLDIVEVLNCDENVDGILIQLPLPKHIDTNVVLNFINPKKDVDGFHPENMGNLLVGEKQSVACTPRGVMHLLKEYNIEFEGKKAVVIGRSNIVGKPMALLLLEENATVTICHGKTSDLSSYTKEADILVVAIGKPKFITADMVKPGAVVIDVGINRVEEGIVGDVDFEAVKEVASYITPVPGGIGPMTIVSLLENTFELATSEGPIVLKSAC